MSAQLPVPIAGRNVGLCQGVHRTTDNARAATAHWVKPMLGRVTALDYAAELLAATGGVVCCVWSTQTHALLLRIVAPQSISAVALSKSGQWLALASGHRVQVFRVPGGELLLDYEHSAAVTSIHIASGAARIASADADGEVQVRQLEDGVEIWRHQHGAGQAIVFLHSAGHRIAIDTATHTHIFDLLSPRSVAVFTYAEDDPTEPIAGRLNCVLLTRSGSAIRLFDYSSQDRRCARKIDLGAEITSIDISDDDRLFLATTCGGAIHLFGLYAGERVAKYESFTIPLLVAKFGAGRTLYTAGGEALVMEISQGQHIRSYCDESPPLVAGAWSATHRSLLLGDRDGGVSRYDLVDGRRTDFVGHKGSVSVVVCDAEHVATGAYDGSARLWRPDGHQLAAFSPCDGPIQALALDGVRRALWVGTWGGQVLAFDLRTQASTFICKLSDSIRTLCFDPQARRLLAGDNNGKFMVVDLECGARPIFSGEVLGAAYCGRFDADGSVLVTAADGLRRFRLGRGGATELYPCEDARWFDFLPDGEICVLGLNGDLKIFEPQTQRCVCEVHIDDPRPHRVVLGMGDRIFTGSGDGRMRVFDDKLAQVAELQRLRSGVLWTTTPAGAHPGWLFTDRPDLVAIGRAQDGVMVDLPDGDARRQLHQATFNSAGHAMEIVAGSLGAKRTSEAAHHGLSRIAAPGLRLTFQRGAPRGGGS